MQLLPTVLAAGTGEAGLRFVNSAGAVFAEFSARSGRTDGPTAEAEILRGELSRILVEACATGVDYVFGDYVTSLAPDLAGVTVTFAKAESRRFDMVIIAEGTQSRTRGLVFGRRPRIRDLGLYTAYGTIARSDHDDMWWRWYNARGGRSVTLRPDNMGTARATLSFLSRRQGYESLSVSQQQAVLRARFAGAGWETPRILDGFESGDELYVEHLSQVRASTWSTGRVVLTGDAAWCASPVSGMGATLAVTGAYILAGEISQHDDVRVALTNYERRMRPFVERIQRLPPGVPRLAHPVSGPALLLFRTALRLSTSAPVRFLADRSNSGPADDHFELPAYQFERPPTQL